MEHTHKSEDSHIDQEKPYTIALPCSEAPSLYLQDNIFLTKRVFQSFKIPELGTIALEYELH